MKRKKMKYIHYDKRAGAYSLSKKVNGRSVYIGSTTEKPLILKLKKKCQEADWDYDKLMEIKEYFMLHKGVLEEKYGKKRQEKYIHELKDRPCKSYQIMKQDKYGRKQYYGVYRTLNHAVKVRDELIKNNWNRKKVNLKLRPRYTENYIKEGEQHNIYYNDETQQYEVRKIVNYKLKTFATTPTIEEARKIRDKLQENNWQT